jgi:hypothetical protein
MWRAGQLLGNDREMGRYTREVSGQRLGKHVPAARKQFPDIATVGLQQWMSYIFYVVRVEKLYARRSLELS